MFREMRRTERKLDRKQAEHILVAENYGVLCVHGEDGFPYGVPVNYGFVEGKFYIHSTSRASHKLDAIRKDPKVCLTVVSQHHVIPEEYTTDFSSAMVFGTARIITEAGEKTQALKKMMLGLAPDLADQALEQYKNAMDGVVLIEITPAHITGKARKPERVV